MCSIIAAVILALTGIFGWGAFSTFQQDSMPPAIATVAAPQLLSCESVSPEEDIHAALALVGDTFASDDWTQEIRNNEVRTTVSMLSDRFGAVAYLEYLHYDCGVTDATIANYFSPQGFDAIFADYASYEQVAQCQRKALTLHEFEATLRDTDYHIMLWYEKTSPTRVANMMLIFPTGEWLTERDYAGQLYPELPACEDAS